MAPGAIFPFSHSARKSFRMLWPAATNLHSSVTFSRPLGVNLVNPRFLLTSPNTVSTSTERLFRKADPASVRGISPARLLKAFKAGFTWIRFGESASTSSTSPCGSSPSSPRARMSAPRSRSPGQTPAAILRKRQASGPPGRRARRTLRRAPSWRPSSRRRAISRCGTRGRTRCA